MTPFAGSGIGANVFGRLGQSNCRAAIATYIISGAVPTQVRTCVRLTSSPNGNSEALCSTVSYRSDGTFGRRAAGIPGYTGTVGKAKQKVALAVDGDLLTAARKLALDQRTSVNQLVREFLAALVEEPSRKQMHGILTKNAKEIEVLRAELSKLHHLVTARMTKQIEYLHKQAYDLKRISYHPNQAVAPAAFNGQFSKHRIFSALCGRFQFDAFVETGTHLGKTTEFLASHGKPVYSVECNPTFHEEAQYVLHHLPMVHLTLADSPEFLRRLLDTDLPHEAMSFFYLDAHWNNPLPLADEIRIIATQHPHAIVMVDDFKVENDEGYGYDVYNFGQEITFGFLQEPLRESNWQIFFPTLPAALDHNANDILPPRGTAIVACEQEAINTLKEVTELRHWPF